MKILREKSKITLEFVVNVDKKKKPMLFTQFFCFGKQDN